MFNRFTAILYKEGASYLVDVPLKVSEQLGQKGHVPVKGTLNNHPIRATLIPKGGGQHKMFINRAMREATGLLEGEEAQLALELDQSSRELPIPEDLQAAFEAWPEAYQKWRSNSPSHRNRLILFVNEVKSEAARANRIEKGLAHLMKDI